MTLDGQNANRRDDGQDGCQTVEHPFASRHMDFQVMHRVVHTV